ncbi:hypothetical protein GWK47_001840 [Chionoecetes opilio]|uniref:Sushi domain-containing protein n=1 Tax=Chionoecetes opilio TaxID=41210 RepID=A0A8J4XRM5_CHIOP|nr:hypothetical protein GWK47_001840 [Chionoecetes opilio]
MFLFLVGRATMMRMVVLMMVMVVVMAAMVVMATAAGTDDEVNLISRANMSTDKCSSLHISQGQVSPHKRSYLVGEVVTVRCARGYVLRWEHKLHCGPEGVWHNPEGYAVLPHCRSLQCGSPEIIPRGKVDTSWHPTPLTTGGAWRPGGGGEERRLEGVWYRRKRVWAEYSCEAGYRLLSAHASHASHLSQHLTCRHGEWQGEVPQCGECVGEGEGL